MNRAVGHRVRAACLPAFCAALLLAGCSASADASDAAKAADRTTTSTTAPSTGSKAVPNAVTEMTHQPGEGTFTGARDDVKVTSCAADGGGWKVSGTATNSTAAPVDYRIFVSMMAADEVVALVEVAVDDVAAGKAKPFERAVKVDAKSLKCVLRVERRARS